MKVSVVIPTHNRAELVKKAIDSVLKQTYSNLEVIVVSDGSTDETDVVLQKYKEQDSRFKYITYHPARGANYARNIGISASEGEFIAFLDDDDEWMPNKVELQLQEFNKDKKVGLVYTGVEIIYHYKDKIIKYYSMPKKTGDLSNDILTKNWIGTTSSVIIRKSILREAGGFDENLRALQDYDLWIRVCRITKVGAVFEPLVKYHNYVWSNQISNDLNKYEEAINLVRTKYVDYFKNNDVLLKQHKLRSYIILAQKALRTNNPTIARKYIKEGLKLSFSFNLVAMYLASFLKYETILKLRSIIK